MTIDGKWKIDINHTIYSLSSSQIVNNSQSLVFLYISSLKASSAQKKRTPYLFCCIRFTQFEHTRSVIIRYYVQLVTEKQFTNKGLHVGAKSVLLCGNVIDALPFQSRATPLPLPKQKNKNYGTVIESEYLFHGDIGKKKESKLLQHL